MDVLPLRHPWLVSSGNQSHSQIPNPPYTPGVGELYWSVNAADTRYTGQGDGISSWDQQWLAGGNGDGSLTYPGTARVCVCVCSGLRACVCLHNLFMRTLTRALMCSYSYAYTSMSLCPSYILPCLLRCDVSAC